MAKYKRSPLSLSEVKKLGLSQRRVLEALENSREGMTFGEIFERINLIPTFMGSMLDNYADMKLAIEGNDGKLDVKSLIRDIREMVDRAEEYLLEEDKEILNSEVGLFERVYPIGRDIKRLNTYIKIKNLDLIREQLEEADRDLGDSQEPIMAYKKIISFASVVTKIAEEIDAYRQDMKYIQAVGRSETVDSEKRKMLSNSLRATLYRTIGSLESRGLLAEVSYPANAHWKEARSKFIITEKGYEVLQHVKGMKGKVLYDPDLAVGFI